MRTINLFAIVSLGALASTALAACAGADSANDERNVTVENGGVSPLAVDAGFDSGGGSTNPGPVQQYKAASNVAMASYYDWYTGDQLNLRAGKGNDNKVHIDYWQNGWDPTSQICVDPPFPPDPSWPPLPPYCFYTRRVTTYAYGTVPSNTWRASQDFSQIRANITNGPTMTIVSCVEEWPMYSCNPHPGGLIDVTWRENGWFSSTTTGSREDTYGLMTIRVSGSFTSKGADATGTVLGISLNNAQGNILRSTGSNVTFSSYLKP